MDPSEFERLLHQVDSKIDEAKREEERKGRLETAEKRRTTVLGWLDGLRMRVDEAKRLNLPEVIAALEVPIKDLDREREELDRRIAELAGRPAPVVEIDPMEKADVLQLIGEIEQADLAQHTPDELWCLFEIWAIRWRIAVERLGQGPCQIDRHVRYAFVILRERMDAHKKGSRFIAALVRHKGGDWPARLRMAQERWEAITKNGEEDPGEKALGDLAGIVSTYGPGLPGDAEGMRLLRHHLRVTGRFEALHEEVADMVRRWRNHLESEFAYLWPAREASEPEPESKRLSNREVFERILRRMKSKAMIGGCHGPFEKICQGFAGHDYGRSKEAMERLIAGGVIRSKASCIGQRVSIDSSWVTAVEGFLAGKPIGAPAVDEWCEQEAAA